MKSMFETGNFADDKGQRNNSRSKSESKVVAVWFVALLASFLLRLTVTMVVGDA